jgi:hypothetical protein
VPCRFNPAGCLGGAGNELSVSQCAPVRALNLQPAPYSPGPRAGRAKRLRRDRAHWTGDRPDPRQHGVFCCALLSRAFAVGSALRAMWAISVSFRTAWSAPAGKVQQAVPSWYEVGSCVGWITRMPSMQGTSRAVIVPSVMQMRTRPPTSARLFIRSVLMFASVRVHRQCLLADGLLVSCCRLGR